MATEDDRHAWADYKWQCILKYAMKVTEGAGIQLTIIDDFAQSPNP
jgi:hypothetical protein